MPLNIDIQQILLHMLNFVILFAVLYFLLYKPVKKFIDDREEEYKKASDEAKGKLDKANEALSTLDAAIAEKDEAAKRERSELAAKAQEEYNTKIADAEKTAEDIINDARAEAESIRKKAIDKSSDDISELAARSVEKAVMSSAEEAFEAFLAAVERENANG